MKLIILQSFGSIGGKIAGAGGGGFLLLITPSDKKQVANKISNLELIPINYEPYGSRVILNI